MPHTMSNKEAVRVRSVLAMVGVGTGIIAVVYSYYVLRATVMITKCPSCGRIMQKVAYSEKDGESRRFHYECAFCETRFFKPSQHGKKVTLYP